MALTLVFVAYALILITLVSRHAVWRDEMHPLSMILESRSLPDLFRNLRLHDEGQQRLWYLVLYAAHALVPAKVVLKIANAALALASAWVVLFRSPFSLIERALFVFSFFPLYEYGVKSRCYALTTFLLFTACVLYAKRGERFPALGLVLGLLANANPSAWILTAGISAGLAVELLFFRTPAVPRSASKTAIGFALIASGMIAAAAQGLPGPNAIMTPFRFLRFEDVLTTIPRSVLSEGSFAAEAFRENGPFPVALVMVFLYVYLLRKPSLLVMLFVAVTGLDLFHRLVYPASVRHLGFFWLAMIVALWMDASTADQLRWKSGALISLVSFFRRARGLGLPVLLAIELVRGIPPAWRDFQGEFSSSKRAARYITSRPELRRAVIVGEPDYLAEALPYYLDNPIFIPRERRFSAFVSYTTANKAELTLEELLEAARFAARTTGRPALILVGHPLIGEMVTSYSYSKRFAVAPKALSEFRRETKLLESFRDARMSDENYEMYLLSDPRDGSR